MVNPQEEPMLHSILIAKIVEIKLMMMGIPKTEINEMSRQELQILLQLLAHINRDIEEEQ